MTSVRCIRLDTAGNRGFSGARIVPGADAWRERETSMRLDPDGWLVRRNIADATIMKTRMRLRSHIGGGVCLSERNEKKCQKLCKGDVLPLDRSLLMGVFPILLIFLYSYALAYEAPNAVLQGFATLRVAKLLVELDRFAEPHVLQNLALFEVA